MKLFILIAALLMSPTCVFASAVLPSPTIKFNPDILAADNASFVGAKYNGIPVTYSPTIVGANINYLDAIDIQYGTITVRLPGQTSKSVQPGARVRIILKGSESKGYGAVSYKAVRDNFNAWNKSVAQNAATVATFEDSGIRINMVNHQNTAWQEFTSTCNPMPCKKLPEWTVTIIATMTLHEMENIFLPALIAWNNQYNYFGSPSQNDISGGGMSGKILVYKKN